MEEARHYVVQVINEERANNIGDTLDPEQEKEIEECLELDEELHPFCNFCKSTQMSWNLRAM